jgi:hypothetical protein
MWAVVSSTCQPWKTLLGCLRIQPASSLGQKLIYADHCGSSCERCQQVQCTANSADAVGTAACTAVFNETYPTTGV